MRTISGRVRPFGQGTKPLFVRFEFPETPDEVEAISDRISGDTGRGISVLAAKKAMIYVQDEIRDADLFEGMDMPEEEDTEAWADLQAQVNELVEAAVIDPGTFPGETKSKTKDEATEARQDPEAAAALIDELKARHGL